MESAGFSARPPRPRRAITIQSVARRHASASLPKVPDPRELKQRIEEAIPGARAEVRDFTGGGDHFEATVTAPAFAGLSRLEQHRLIYNVFGAEIGGPIHALSLTTKPE